MFGTENAMANDAPAESLSQPQTEKPKVEPQNVDRYFSLLIPFINSHNMVRNYGKLSFNRYITVPSFFSQCPHFFLKCPHIFKSSGTLSPVLKFLGRTLVQADGVGDAGLWTEKKKRIKIIRIIVLAMRLH